MLDNIGNIDPGLTNPSLFRVEDRPQLVAVLSSETQRYSEVLGTIPKYMPELGEFEPHVREIILGTAPVTDLISRKTLDSSPAKVVTSADSEQAIIERDQASNRIVDLISSYQSFLMDGIVPKYGDDYKDEAARDSWQATWKLLREVLAQQDKTNMAGVVELFDGLVSLRYPNTYNKQDDLRGVEARQDISAVAFYETFGKDIRANTWGSTKDN